MRVVPFEDLTPEQQAFAALPTTGHVAAVGAPGSGKTLVLVHRAWRLLREGTDPRRILLVTYTNALETYIRTGLQEVGLPRAIVISYDALMRNLHAAIAGKPYEAPAKPGGSKAKGKKRKGLNDEDFNGQRDAVNTLLKQERDHALFTTEHRWDVILVDETQDLAPHDVETLTMLGRHITVVLDSRQQLYKRGGDVHDILAVLELRWQSASFLYNFRCSQSVLQIARCAAESQEDRNSLPDTAGRAVPEIRSRRVLAADRDEEDEYLHEAIKARVTEGSCAVLLPSRYYAYGIAKALREAGFAVEGPDKIEPSSDAIKVLTYHAAKGLTFDSVFLPRLWEQQLREVARHTKRGSLLFVALTRATSYLFMSATAGKQAREWAEFDTVDEKYLETIVTSEVRPAEAAVGGERKTSQVVNAEVALDDYV